MQEIRSLSCYKESANHETCFILERGRDANVLEHFSFKRFQDILYCIPKIAFKVQFHISLIYLKFPIPFY